MSYSHQMEQRLVNQVTAIAMQTPAIKARLINTGLFPLRVVGAAVVIEVAMTVTAAVINITHRPTIGSATGETTLDTITVPTARAIGDVVYVTGLDKRVLPGEEVTMTLATASTAGSGHFIINTVPDWDGPGNNSNMFLSA